jgi:DNA-binding transcriptional MerR regulator
MDHDHATWTLAELTDRVAAALAVGYRGQRSGRVRDVPDQRAIRWYTTLGLVDRPAAMRGRTALYGRRHLLQLVAIKRLQAGGRSLSEVQVELAAASDERLERIARLPAAATGAAAAARAVEPTAPRGAERARFWAAGPAAAADLPAAPRADPAAAAPQALPGQPGVAQLQAIRLGDGVTLLVGAARPLDGEDLAALRSAAAPLLAALRARGLDRPATHRRELP